MSKGEESSGLLGGLIEFCLRNKLIVLLGVGFFLGWGFLVAPFDWEFGGLPRDPVPVDAIPDIGENQQIVFTEWPGRSPRDVDDQITYPLASELLGVNGVRTVRSASAISCRVIASIALCNCASARPPILDTLVESCSSSSENEVTI